MDDKTTLELLKAAKIAVLKLEYRDQLSGKKDADHYAKELRDAIKKAER